MSQSIPLQKLHRQILQKIHPDKFLHLDSIDPEFRERLASLNGRATDIVNSLKILYDSVNDQKDLPKNFSEKMILFVLGDQGQPIGLKHKFSIGGSPDTIQKSIVSLFQQILESLENPGIAEQPKESKSSTMTSSTKWVSRLERSEIEKEKGKERRWESPKFSSYAEFENNDSSIEGRARYYVLCARVNPTSIERWLNQITRLEEESGKKFSKEIEELVQLRAQFLVENRPHHPAEAQKYLSELIHLEKQYGMLLTEEKYQIALMRVDFFLTYAKRHPASSHESLADLKQLEQETRFSFKKVGQQIAQIRIHFLLERSQKFPSHQQEYLNKIQNLKKQFDL